MINSAIQEIHMYLHKCFMYYTYLNGQMKKRFLYICAPLEFQHINYALAKYYCHLLDVFIFEILRCSIWIIEEMEIVSFRHVQNNLLGYCLCCPHVMTNW